MTRGVRVHHLASPQETKNFGRRFASELCPGDVVLLEGGLGSGKTTLVKGIAAGLGVREEVTSPTFVLRKRYAVTGPHWALNHVDAYRLSSDRELRGVFDSAPGSEQDELWVIEWGGKFGRAFPGRPLWILRLSVTGLRSRNCAIVRAPRR